MLSSIKLLADYYNVTIEDIYKGEQILTLASCTKKLDPPRQTKGIRFR